jgi:hypothetical protein
MIDKKVLRFKSSANRWVQTQPGLIFWVGLIGIMLFGIIQASVMQFGHSLNIDEPFTANTIQLSLSQIFETLRYDNNAPLHYLLLKGWAQLFGVSEFALRSLSILAFGLSILIVGLTARQVMGWQEGLVAALLLAVSTKMGLAHATSARPYALLCLEISLVMLIIFPLMGFTSPMALKPRVSTSVKDVLLYLLLISLNILALFTHYTYIFFMCAYVLAAILVSKRLFLILSVCSAVSFALFLGIGWPILSVSLSLPSTNWMYPPGLVQLIRAFANLWGTTNGTLLLTLLLTYLTATMLFSFRHGIKILTNKLVLVSLSIFGVASLLPFVISQFRPIFLESRTPIIFLPIACLLTATLINQLGNWVLTGIVLTLLVIITTVSSVQAFIGPDPYPVRAAVQYVLDRAKCGDTLVLGSLSGGEVEYYLHYLNAPSCLQREIFPLSTQDHPGWMDIPGLLSQSDKLALEAATTTKRLASEPELTVWLFHSTGTGYSTTRYGYEVTEFLKQELDRKFILRDELDLGGSFFDKVLVYSTN